MYCYVHGVSSVTAPENAREHACGTTAAGWDSFLNSGTTSQISFDSVVQARDAFSAALRPLIEANCNAEHLKAMYFRGPDEILGEIEQHLEKQMNDTAKANANATHSGIHAPLQEQLTTATTTATVTAASGAMWPPVQVECGAAATTTATATTQSTLWALAPRIFERLQKPITPYHSSYSQTPPPATIPGHSRQALETTAAGMTVVLEQLVAAMQTEGKAYFFDKNKGKDAGTSDRHQWLPSEFDIAPTAVREETQLQLHTQLTYRKQQLREFYQVHHVSKVAEVDELLGRYKFIDIVASLQHKYGTLPAGWGAAAQEEAQVSNSVAVADVRIRTYVNNVHPRQHQSLYRTIESIFGRFVPLFEAVLSDSAGTQHNRISEFVYSSLRSCMPSLPAFSPRIAGKPVSLRKQRLQVIVKMGSIRLTPGKKAAYAGGGWHVEGMQNESIVATGIYYFGSENITESKLEFREAVEAPCYTWEESEILPHYGMDPGTSNYTVHFHMYIRMYIFLFIYIYMHI
jgi:hypothetical protein